LAAVALAGCAAAEAQLSVNVDVTKPVNVLTSQTIGVYTQAGDGDLLTPQTLSALRSAGVDTLTYPTGWNSLANQYHWSTNKFTKVENAGDPPYMAAQNSFGQFMLALQKYGMSAIIHVNYGSNAKGTGGGEPNEAAAWVAYANGSASNNQVIGVDGSGEDWKTVGYWASIRSAAPLANDDGYNFLRISHPDPLGIELWQVGEDMPDNGAYGADHKGTLDLHAPYPGSASDYGKRRKLKELSGGFYGEQVVAFAKIMKAVDPAIQVGASLSTPAIDTWDADWNPAVLKAACKDIDFVAFSWHPGSTMPPDWHTLDDNSVLTTPAADLPRIFSEDLYEDKKACPAGKTPRVVLSDFSPISWATMTKPIVAALFAAESFAALAEAGISNSSWYQLRENGLFDKENKPAPAFYGTQMLHIVANKPGDAFVAATGARGSIVAFGTHRKDGVIGVLLTNHDAANAQTVTITVSGAQLNGDGFRFEYGPAQQAKSAGPDRIPIKTDGNSLRVTVPPYGIVSVLLGSKRS